MMRISKILKTLCDDVCTVVTTQIQQLHSSQLCGTEKTRVSAIKSRGTTFLRSSPRDFNHGILGELTDVVWSAW